MPTHPIYGNYLATYTPMVGVSIGAPITIGGFDPLTIDPVFYVDASTSMLGVLEAPPLDLNPAVPSSLDIITATRAGVATYTDASGNIQTASPNTVRVDHVQGEELTPTKFQRVLNTDFSSGWVQGGLTISDGGGLGGEVSKVVENDDAGSGNTFYFNVPTVEGQTYTGGFWIRRLSGSGLIALHHTFSPTGSQTPITNDVTSEWTFVSTQFLGRNGGGDVRFGVRVYYTTGDSVEIAMPQVEEGTTASDFVENTTGSPKYFAAATYAPRVPMMLIEPAATNFARFTDFSNGWTTLGSAPVTSETGDGLAGQPSVILTATANSGRFRQGCSGDVAGVTYTASIWIRRISGSGSIRFEHNSSPTGGTSSSLNITEEWSRVEAQFEGDCFAWGIQIDTSGDSVEIAMPQVEEGTVATSYIPTDGSAVTRNGDILKISGSDFTNFYNTDEGTFYVEFTPKDFTAGEQYLLRGGDHSRRIIYSNGGLTNIRSYDGANVLTMSNTVESNVFHRIAVSFDSTTMKGSLDGATEVTSTHNGNLLTSPLLEVGGPNYIGHIKRVIYWPLHSDSL